MYEPAYYPALSIVLYLRTKLLQDVMNGIKFCYFFYTVQHIMIHGLVYITVYLVHCDEKSRICRDAADIFYLHISSTVVDPK
jgi:predicted nucleic acid-binding protein